MKTLGRRITGVSCTALLGLCATQTLAMEPVSGWHLGPVFAYDEGLLDYLKFPRDKLAENGVNVHFSLMSVYQNIVDGGLDGADDDELSASYDLQLYFDTAKLGWWEGGYAVLRAEGKTDDAGVNFSTGAIIPVNFDAMVPEPEGNDFELTEWWYAQQFAGGKTEVVGGMWDIARFFDLSPFSGPYHYRFLNSHMFFNSVLLPYAPYNKLGGVLTLKPLKGLTITTSVADPNSSAIDVDWFDEGDFDLLHEWRYVGQPFGTTGMYAIGVAYRDKELATIADASETEDSDWALYANFNQWLYQNPDDPHEAIGLFGRLGFTDGEINIIERHYSLGVVFDGMIDSRPKDSAGVVGWYNEFSDDLSSALDDSSAGFEAYYRFQVTPWLQLTPDVQYLIEPGLTKGNDDTLVLGLRALIHL